MNNAVLHSRRLNLGVPHSMQMTEARTCPPGLIQGMTRTLGGEWISEAASKYWPVQYGIEQTELRHGWMALRYGLATAQRTMGKETRIALQQLPQSMTQVRIHIRSHALVWGDISSFTYQEANGCTCGRSRFWALR
jgi:hypothetical protein